MEASDLKAIQRKFGKRLISCEEEDKLAYSFDSSKKIFMPDAVFFPENTKQISLLLKIANEKKIPIIARGSGTGTTGGSLPVKGGIVISMQKLNKIVIDKKNLIANVEAGAITADIQKEAQKYNLFYPPDPSSSQVSTIGGNIAECAGGPKALKYGVTKDYILALKCVLANGEIIDVGTKTKKGVVGYDLCHLIVGSEGTLAIVTEATLKLIPAPSGVGTLIVSFKNAFEATSFVSDLLGLSVFPRSIEFLDKASIECLENKNFIGEDAEALLIIEVDGKKNHIFDLLNEIYNFCMKKGCISCFKSEDEKEQNKIRNLRSSLSPLLFKYAPFKINEDIVVPIEHLPLMIEKIESLSKKTKLKMVAFGHAGDGNIHVNIMLDKNNQKQLEKAMEARSEIFEYTLALGGTISGEHGIGISKKDFMLRELKNENIEIMKKIKKIFDPNNILNPNKIFDI